MPEVDRMAGLLAYFEKPARKSQLAAAESALKRLVEDLHIA